MEYLTRTGRRRGGGPDASLSSCHRHNGRHLFSSGCLVTVVCFLVISSVSGVQFDPVLGMYRFLFQDVSSVQAITLCKPRQQCIEGFQYFLFRPRKVTVITVQHDPEIYITELHILSEYGIRNLSSPKLSGNDEGCFYICNVGLTPGEGKPRNQVSIEDFIDLDDWVPSNAVINDKGHEDQVVLGKGVLYANSPASKPDVVVAEADDEDFMASGSGSGSGDSESSTLSQGGSVDSVVLTPTKGLKMSSANEGKQSSDKVDISITEGGTDTKPVMNKNMPEKVLRINEPPSRRSQDAQDDLDGNTDSFDEDAVYDLPGTSTLNSNNIINPASWLEWSQWQIVGSSAKVRVRTCQIGGHEVSDSSCDGVRVQIRACVDAAKDDCGRVEDVRTGSGSSSCEPNVEEGIVKATNPEPTEAPPTPTFHVATSPAQEPTCEYSLYDTYRHKFVFTRWNLTQVMSQSKLKKWCDKTSGQYVVMTTPTKTCRRLYKDLCQAAQKCRSSKPARERGDFAEGCWRGLVYGDMLPVGLSNKQTIIYFICQRFTADSAMGRSFGYKETHFGTLYDTQLRSPVLSLHKMAQVGDETWPETNYFIEYGLVEEQKNMLWLFRRPRKGMLTLSDLDRCYDEQACDVGLRQVLPADYDLMDQARYTPTPLVWPEWMPPSPAPRMSTFTLTNTAPMLTALYDEWQAKVQSVRKYAIQECGVPYDATPNLSHVGQMSARRTNKAALYIASGVIPTQNPSKAIGRDVNVPFMFWMAGCCVQQHTSNTTNNKDNSNSNSNNADSQSYFFGNLNDETKMVTNITAFSLYVQNTVGNHVIAAPVLQLELLLQDMYKVKPSDPEVSLFPGQDAVCSDLQYDVSRWFL